MAKSYSQWITELAQDKLRSAESKPSTSERLQRLSIGELVSMWIALRGISEAAKAEEDAGINNGTALVAEFICQPANRLHDAVVTELKRRTPKIGGAIF
jgi:hypothetical protein